MDKSLSEFEVRRYKSLAKRFVEIYIMEEPLAAGHYIQGELREQEQLEILREFVVDAFKDHGYAFTELEKVLND